MAALDKKLRTETQFELTRLQRQLGTTFVIVTHDQEEAMTVADRIAVMDRGRLVQVAPPAEIYEAPASRWVAEFIGDVNLVEGVVESVREGVAVMSMPGGERFNIKSGEAPVQGRKAWIAIRPEKLQLVTARPEGPGENIIAGTVEGIAYRGSALIYRVRSAAGMELKVAAANTQRRIAPQVQAGQPVWLSFAPDAALLLAE
jgi:putrescine transport system ATP-binding protein